jgi:hypothetical protein
MGMEAENLSDFLCTSNVSNNDSEAAIDGRSDASDSSDLIEVDGADVQGSIVQQIY